MTQCERIIEYMERFGSISPMEAFADLGVITQDRLFKEQIRRTHPLYEILHRRYAVMAYMCIYAASRECDGCGECEQDKHEYDPRWDCESDYDSNEDAFFRED